MELAEPAPEELAFELEEPAPEEPPAAASPSRTQIMPVNQDTSSRSPSRAIRIRNRSLKETPPKLARESRRQPQKEAAPKDLKARQLALAEPASPATAAGTLRQPGRLKASHPCALCGKVPSSGAGKASSAADSDGFLSPPPGLEMVSRSSDKVVDGNARRRPRRVQMKECTACGATCRLPVAPRLWCSFYLKMKHPTFELVPMLIGRGGCNTKGIADVTKAKVRVRGKGSGHLEFPTNQEAPTPLMLVVATENENKDGFNQAIQMTIELLRTIEARYRDHCREVGHVDNSPGFTIGPPCDNGHPELRALIRNTMHRTALQVKNSA